MSVLTATTLISTHGAIWNYPGCWHQMYPHINRSTWPKCWPNMKLMSCSVTLGHQIPLPGSTGGWGCVWWQASLTHRLTKWQADLRYLYRGVHLTKDHVTTGLCDQCSHTHGHQMSMHGGRFRLTFCLLGSQPASQLASLPAAIVQPASHVARYQPVRLWVGHICGGRRTRSPNTLGPSPGSQHSHWFPLGSDLAGQGQARKVTQMSSAACYIPLALCLVTICSFVSMLPNHIFLHTM